MFIVFHIKQMYVIVQWGGVRVLCFLMSPTSMPFVSPFCSCFLGRATHFLTAGWHAAWVNRKVGSKDRQEDEMFLTNVTAYQVSMHDACHVVLYVRTVPGAHFQ